MSQNPSLLQNPALSSRVLGAASSLVFKFALWFALAVGVQWLSVVTMLFGDRPVIPVAFFTCVNVLATLAVVPMVLVGLLIQLRTPRPLPRLLLALLLAAGAIFGAFQLWWVVLR